MGWAETGKWQGLHPRRLLVLSFPIYEVGKAVLSLQKLFGGQLYMGFCGPFPPISPLHRAKDV